MIWDMGYSSYTAEFKIECVRRYFSPPRISARLLALEKGVPFHTLQDWIRKAKNAGMLNPGETLPAMVEVKAAAPIAPVARETADAVPAATFSVAIGKATLTLPSSMLAQVLRELSR